MGVVPIYNLHRTKLMEMVTAVIHHVTKQPEKKLRSKGGGKKKSAKGSTKKSSGKKKGKKSKISRTTDVKSPVVDPLSNAAMLNAYYIAHGPVEFLQLRGYGWEGGPKKTKKGKKKKK